MSRAFVKENDDNDMLHQVEPNLLPCCDKVDNNGREVFVKNRREE